MYDYLAKYSVIRIVNHKTSDNRDIRKEAHYAVDYLQTLTSELEPRILDIIV